MRPKIVQLTEFAGDLYALDAEGGIWYVAKYNQPELTWRKVVNAYE